MNPATTNTNPADPVALRLTRLEATRAALACRFFLLPPDMWSSTEEVISAIRTLAAKIEHQRDDTPAATPASTKCTLHPKLVAAIKDHFTDPAFGRYLRIAYEEHYYRGQSDQSYFHAVTSCLKAIVAQLLALGLAPASRVSELMNDLAACYVHRDFVASNTTTRDIYAGFIACTPRECFADSGDMRLHAPKHWVDTLNGGWDTARQCWVGTGPFLKASGSDRDAAIAYGLKASLSATGSNPSQPLPVPKSVDEKVAERKAKLEAERKTLAEAVIKLYRPGTLPFMGAIEAVWATLNYEQQVRIDKTELVAAVVREGAKANPPVQQPEALSTADALIVGKLDSLKALAEKTAAEVDALVARSKASGTSISVNTAIRTTDGVALDTPAARKAMVDIIGRNSRALGFGTSVRPSLANKGFATGGYCAPSDSLFPAGLSLNWSRGSEGGIVGGNAAQGSAAEYVIKRPSFDIKRHDATMAEYQKKAECFRWAYEQFGGEAPPSVDDMVRGGAGGAGKTVGFAQSMGFSLGQDRTDTFKAVLLPRGAA